MHLAPQTVWILDVLRPPKNGPVMAGIGHMGGGGAYKIIISPK